MFNYTVIRQAETIGEDGQVVYLSTWEAWDVQAKSAKEAVEACADVPAVYNVYEADPKVFEVDHFTRLKAVEVTDDEEAEVADE